MITYITLYFIPSFYSVLSISNNRKKAQIFCLSFSILCVVVLGSRYKVGGDWINYLYIYNHINDYFNPLSINFLQANYLDYLIYYISFNYNLSFYAANFLNQFIFIFGLFFYAIRQTQPSMIFVIAVPYLIIVVSTGYIKQASALGLFLFALSYLFDGKFIKYSFIIFLATLFHKTAFLFIFLAPLLKLNYSYLQILNKIKIDILIFFILLIPFSIFIYYFFLEFQYNYIIRFYIGKENDFVSTGAVFRVALFFLTALLFIMFNKKISMNTYERKTYMILAVGTILFSFFVFNYSSAVDRILIYFYPLQLFVYSRLDLFFYDQKHRIFYNFIIIFLFFLVFIIWAYYGQFSNHWIPFQSIFFVQ